MKLEVLQEKALKKEIKLEDLDAEDILKFQKLGFLNPTLEDYFSLSLKEIKKIRQEKNLENAEFEDFVRNMIVLYAIVKEKYPYSIPLFINETIKDLVITLGLFRGKTNAYLKKYYSIDWVNMDPLEEINKRKIDVEFRQNENKELFQTICKVLSNHFPESIHSNPNLFKEEYDFKKENHKTKRPITTNSYSRDNSVTTYALERACYCCELNPKHSSFISRHTNKPFMIGHHLIPLNQQYKFKYSLDVPANIVCLCSKCHDEIHHGKNYRELIKILYEQRKEALLQCGIIINDINELYAMYDYNNSDTLISV